MTDKYRMTQEQNAFVAKRNIIDYIWKSAKLEGLGVTYPDTEAIFNGMAVPGVKVSEIVAVNNLKHAWQFLLDTLDVPFDYAYLCKLNQLVGGDLIIEAGYLRKLPVSIGGTTWKPDMPDDLEIRRRLRELQGIEGATERAITLMLYIIRGQFFLDGNKRTAMLAANQVMISGGAGVIAVPIEQQRDFTRLLAEYYESNNPDAMMQFVYAYCIDGIAFENGAL
ncbi:MAG: Fic family protein [Oscillospiraceae bacterium]|nr:Fic family protein [Oscillospiraceae bacterium]